MSALVSIAAGAVIVPVGAVALVGLCGLLIGTGERIADRLGLPDDQRTNFGLLFCLAALGAGLGGTLWWGISA